MTDQAPEPAAEEPPMPEEEREAVMTAEFVEALFAFQAAVDAVKKTGQNEHLRSTYADLNAVWAAIRAPLQENNLLVLQEPRPHARGAMVTTTLYHTSGAYRRSTLFIPARKSDAQAFGSAITYCRRYSLMIVLGLNSTDDDGHAATIEPPPARPEVQPTAPPPADQAEVAVEKGWQNWAQSKLLQVQGCESQQQLIDCWNGLQPELKKAPAEVRAGLTSAKDQRKAKFTEGGLPGTGDPDSDVPF